MRPINEKERTVAFFKFLILFLLTIILCVFFVFWNTKTERKNYDEKSKKAKEFERTEKYVANITSLMDSIRIGLNELSKLDKNSYLKNKNLIESKYMSRLKYDSADPEYGQNLKNVIYTTLDNWKADLENVQEKKELENKLLKKEKRIENLRNYMKEYCKLKEDDLNRIDDKEE